ncbi:unnamed protein product [Acanthoscelides obtectus]|uniref:Coiled-coil domain-containing protein n=2 Tax=Acanthoscelides obtectus TaxID=200917 RepID=A0A9P0MG33_ACAOB|nr:unnamed protein product [Acanthoscelides obtectus]CAK1622060.1 hypothetical protein AOBTE_LOCUS1291 [Acanthoscelides obtectus]
MPDNARLSSPRIPTSTSWSIESLKSDQKVIRKFINSAIYVEKPIMPPLRKKSPMLAYSSEEDTHRLDRAGVRTNRIDRAVKRCTCNTSPDSCPFHQDKKQDSARTNRSNRTNRSGASGDLMGAKMTETSDESSSSDTNSQITVRSRNAHRVETNDGSTNRNDTKGTAGSEFRLSLSPLNSHRSMDLDPKEKDEIIKNWLRKKDEEKKRKESEQAKIRAKKEKQKQAQMEKEKENFRKWLENKKSQEETARKETERKEKEKQRKEEEKLRKQKEGEASFNSWLKKKKRHELERKIKEKLTMLHLYEERERRIEENEKAFNDWLKNSKNKPKPLPLNQGLDSMCSSTSVTYINPVPWTPNVEDVKAK